MTHSYLDEASELLSNVKGKPQSVAERKRLAIDLAALMIKEAARTLTSQERATQDQLARLMRDPVGKAFTTAMTDQCFRSSSNHRIADQMTYLLNHFGVPQYLDWMKRVQLFVFKILGSKISQYLVPIATHALRKETTRVILPGEPALLIKHLKERKAQGILLNLNHLGEAILSEPEAKK